MLSAQEVLLTLYGRPQSSDGVALLPKSSSSSVTLPFFDDFSNYTGCPNPNLWRGCDAWVNNSYAFRPLTVGMVTLDALDANGNLHKGAAVGRFAGDTLCSRNIRLDSSFGAVNKRLSPSDSVLFSFYYLPGGGAGEMWRRVGSTPGLEDSLILEFYNPVQKQWEMVWSTPGISEDSLVAWTGHSWQYIMLWIDKPAYFDSTFAFRFRNYCSLSDQNSAEMLGNTDQWNIDYVRLDFHRSVLDECTRDIAFVTLAPSLLRHYQAMPARQFSASEMADSVTLVVNNLYGEQLSAHFEYAVTDDQGVVLMTSDEGYDNVDAFRRNYHSYGWTPHVDFVYPVDPSRNQYFDVEYRLREGVSGDKYRQNDTVRLRQFLSNYFAYDDGTPENGYGLASTNSKVYFANKFVLNNVDTLTALDLYFNQSLDSATEEISFRISIWDDANGFPGHCIYRDEAMMRPVFDGFNRYHRYRLSSPIVLSGTIYVGLEQSNNKYINLGFDRNNDHHESIYYLTSGAWQQSILSGSLMLRPCFGQSALVGINTPTYSRNLPHVSITPNPVSRTFSVSMSDDSYQHSSDWVVLLYDMKGREVLRVNSLENIDVSLLPTGLYLCRICNVLSQMAVSTLRLSICR